MSGATTAHYPTVYRILQGDLDKAERNLHAKYGPLVRIAPNEVICSDPAAIPVLYRTHDPLPKTTWYETFRAQGISKNADLFTERDELKHTRYRKIVNIAYQMSSVLKNESAIDDCTVLFSKSLLVFAQQSKPIDLGHWLELYAYDVIGRVLYGQMLGFLEAGKDSRGWIESTENALPLLHIAAVAPPYMRTPIIVSALLIPGMPKNFKAVGQIADQARDITHVRLSEPSKDINQRNDIMSHLITIMRERGDEIDFTDKEIALESWAGILAGADSVATTMRATFYYLMKSPSKYAKAVAEIADTDGRGLLSSPVQYSEVTAHMPYICACIKEASRLFPSFATRMGRISPSQGLELCGRYIPPGYWAGMNAGTVQYDKGVFGEDATIFRPERWLESQEKTFAMDKAMLLFGAGTRTCIGKNIALAEIHKLVPQLLRHFDIQMAHDREWKTWNAGFSNQSDLIVNVAARS